MAKTKTQCPVGRAMKSAGFTTAKYSDRKATQKEEMKLIMESRRHQQKESSKGSPGRVRRARRRP
ncbi:MAG: hypothetical protein GY772_02670 [bacterium]|nr:hypothetical protein [bacterium]